MDHCSKKFVSNPVAQWLSFVSVAACGAASNPTWCRIFREISFVSPLNNATLFRCCCPWARHLTLKCFTSIRWKWVPGRTEMTMCIISSMRRNGCRTYALRGVEMAQEWFKQVQWLGVKCKMWWNIWYQSETINQNLYLLYVCFRE